MSIVQLRIELPTYAHSFSIHVPDTCTILEVKKEISRICPGQPCVDGQKLIWRGRFLADNEQVDTIWKSPSEPRIVHLSVHPSSWISGPPTVQSSSIPPKILQHTSTILVPASQLLLKSPPASSTAAERLPFVFAKHVEAITVLMEGHLNPAGANSMSGLREDAMKLLELNGWGWPAALDEPYPEVTLGGLKYERVTAEQVPFLSLVNEGAQPTPAQAHALRVLSYTFSISMKELRQRPQSNVIVPTQAIPNRRAIPEIPHVNHLLQQMDLPPLRNIHNAEAVPNQEQGRALNLLPDVAIRPLLASLFMLIVRASLLLYLVAPTRKPIFAVLIIAWMLYEIWQPIRNHLLRHLQENEQDAARPGARAPAQADAPRPDDLSAQLRSQVRGLVETLGNMNLEAEQEALTHATLENEDPGMGRRIGQRIGQTIGTFVTLVFLTLHPAIWNQRRVALRLREEAVRTEVHNGARLNQTDVEEGDGLAEREGQLIQAFRERHFQRPTWIQRYIERVVHNDWDE